jgi:hypothetical protein
VPVSLMKPFFWYKAKVPFLGLLSSNAGLSGFLNYWMSDERNFAVHYLICLVCTNISLQLSDWPGHPHRHINHYLIFLK